jgi:hypothetical protein
MGRWRKEAETKHTNTHRVCHVAIEDGSDCSLVLFDLSMAVVLQCISYSFLDVLRSLAQLDTGRPLTIVTEANTQTF